MTERKGISPLVAAVLLIAFTMAVAGLFSSWAPELLQSVQSDTSDDTEDLLDATNAGLNVDSATFDSDTGNTSVVFRNTGQTELSNFTVTARLEEGGFVQKQVSETVKPAGIVNVELNTSNSPDLVRVNSEELDLSAETETSGDLVDDESSGTLGPTASFSINISGNNASVGEEIEFDASGSTEGDASIDSYNWDFNDTNTSTGEVVTHNYSSEGNYTVELEVTDNNGKTSTNTVEIEIKYEIAESAIHRWKLDEGSGDSVTDSIGNADGQIYGASWKSGTYQGGHSLVGDGDDDLVKTTTLGSFGSSVSEGFSIAFTVETNSESGLLFDGEGPNSDSVLVGVNGDGGWDSNNFAIVLRDSNYDALARELDNGIDDGKRRRLVAVVPNLDVSDWKIFINGTEAPSFVNRDQGATASAFKDFDQPFSLLNDPENGRGENATIDDFIIYDSPLTTSEVKKDYNSQPWS